MRPKVYYDGYDLTNHCRILEVSTYLMPTVSNVYQGLDNENGSHYKRTSLGQQVVEITIGIEKDILYHKDRLNKILYQRTEKRLVIDDMPDRYLMCKLEGDAKFTSRKRYATTTLKFVSSDYSWRSLNDDNVSYVTDNRTVIENTGTAPTYPKFRLHFMSDCGFIGVTAPNGYLALGNPKEQDSTYVPLSEFAMNEEFSDVDKWTKISDIKAWFNNGGPASSSASPRFDKWGMHIDESTTSTNKEWTGHAYLKNFEAGTIESEASNFEYRSRITALDKSGGVKNTCNLFVMLLDKDNRTVMGAHIYDSSLDRNSLTINFYIGNGGEGLVKTHTGTLPALTGFLKMEKSGDMFSWILHHHGTQGAEQAPIQVGDTVYIKDTAQFYYHYNGTKYSIKSFTKGRPNKVTRTRTYQGMTQYEISYQGTVIAWVNEDDLKTNKTVNVGTSEQQVRYTMRDTNVAQLKANKAVVYQAKWGTSKAYSTFEIDSMVIKRLYSSNYKQIENTFMAGDTLEINNEKGEILLNGSPYTGFIDVDSRFFSIDGGKTEIGFALSDWARPISGKIMAQSRWL